MGGIFSRRCRYCQEQIKETDKKCPHCGEEFPEDEPPIGARTSKAYHKSMSYATGTSSLNKDTKENHKKQSCFIATAAYGTPMAKEIEYLRFWRDMSLVNKMGGWQFINFYYRVSPPIALLISKSEFVKMLVREGLSPIIYHLKKESRT